MHRRILASCVGLVSLVCASQRADPAQALHSYQLSIRLKPSSALNDTGRIDQVAVTLRLEGPLGRPGEALLRLPLLASNVDTVATTLRQLSARDEWGDVHLSAREVTVQTDAARDAESGGPSREWFADRMPVGPLLVRYTVDAESPLPPRGAAPPFAFSNDGGGVSAAGHVFLMLPPGPGRYRMSIEWDLSAAPEGSRGVSSLGEGQVASVQWLTSAEVRESFFMAGRIHTWPTIVPARGFFAAWQGAPGFDATELMSWTGILYAKYAKFFEQKAPPPYGVFVRYNPINAGGGVGLFHSFVLTYGTAGSDDITDLKSTLAHEMFHTFQPFIERPAGLASSWFGEGLAVVYETRLPLRFGMISPAEFLKTTNFNAARYYTSVMAAVPNREIPQRFWADTRIRTLPYDRGMLYLKVVDDQTRKASGGKRSLDDLMFRMLQLQRQGKRLSNADWETTLAEFLGAPAVTQFREFLAGAKPLPASEAFGPCFRRTTKPLRRFELGFDPAVLAEPKRIVRGLVADSAAMMAGLRDGDEIVKPVPQDALQGSQKQTLSLIIRRADQTMSVQYLPRGETVDAYQWERVDGVPDSTCAL